jgi:hypothetical protein
VNASGEAASADTVTEGFPNPFGKVTDEGGYLPEQVFNVRRDRFVLYA